VTKASGAVIPCAPTEHDMPPERPGCVAIWQFRVRPECAAEFEALDARCERLMFEEFEVGRMDLIG